MSLQPMLKQVTLVVEILTFGGVNGVLELSIEYGYLVEKAYKKEGTLEGDISI